MQSISMPFHINPLLGATLSALGKPRIRRSNTATIAQLPANPVLYPERALINFASIPTHRAFTFAWNQRTMLFTAIAFAFSDEVHALLVRVLHYFFGLLFAFIFLPLTI